MQLHFPIFAVVATVQLAACGGDAGSPPQAASTTAGSSSIGSQESPHSSPPKVLALQPMIDAALADAAQRTGRPVSALRLIDAESVTWPDGSLGCAEPGVNYTMAPVPGFRIRIQAGGDSLDYHGREGGTPVYCPPGRGGASAPGGTT